MFLLNSCLDLFSAPRTSEDPFSRGYGVSLPSSLAMSLSTPQYVLPGYLCRSAVRVPMELMLSGFSRQHDYLLCQVSPKRVLYCQLSAQEVDLPASLDAYSLQRAFPSARGSVTTASPQFAIHGSHGILTVSAIGLAARLSLRTRLTPG